MNRHLKKALLFAGATTAIMTATLIAIHWFGWNINFLRWPIVIIALLLGAAAVWQLILYRKSNRGETPAGNVRTTEEDEPIARQTVATEDDDPDDPRPEEQRRETRFEVEELTGWRWWALWVARLIVAVFGGRKGEFIKSALSFYIFVYKLSGWLIGLLFWVIGLVGSWLDVDLFEIIPITILQILYHLGPWALGILLFLTGRQKNGPEEHSVGTFFGLYTPWTIPAGKISWWIPFWLGGGSDEKRSSELQTEDKTDPPLQMVVSRNNADMTVAYQYTFEIVWFFRWVWFKSDKTVVRTYVEDAIRALVRQGMALRLPDENTKIAYLVRTSNYHRWQLLMRGVWIRKMEIPDITPPQGIRDTGARRAQEKIEREIDRDNAGATLLVAQDLDAWVNEPGISDAEKERRQGLLDQANITAGRGQAIRVAGDGGASPRIVVGGNGAGDGN